MSIELISIILFASMVLLLVLGHPVAFALGGLTVVFTLWMWPQALITVVTNVWGGMSNFILIAIPLFIFMANMLERSGIADDLYKMMHRWFGPIRGGLAVGTVIICALFAAMSGVSSVGIVTMGLIALPSMLKRGYSKGVAIGCVGAGGALGVLIPPSVVMIVLGLFGSVSIGRLFAGGLTAGLLFVVLFIVYIIVRSYLQPGFAPALPPDQRASWGEKLSSLKAVVLPMLLVIAVLGSIFMGLATPSEAAGIGALGSVICAAIYGKLSWKNVKEASYATLRLTGVCLWIYFGATCFAVIYAALGASELMETVLLGVPGGRWGALIAILFIFIILGCLLDAFGIIAICAPLFFPIIRSIGFDPLWFGILWMLTVEIGYLTPPFGFNLFLLKSVVPKDITITDIYAALAPFVGLQIVGLILTVLFPQIAVWLPNKLFQIGG